MRISVWPLALLLALAGCGQKHEQSKTVTVNGSNGSVTISGNGEHYAMKSSNGNETVEVNTSGAVSGLPGFVPVFPGAKVQSSVIGSGGNGNGGTIVIETSAPIDAVIGFYRRKTQGEGLGQTMFMQTGGSTMFAAGTGKKTIEVIASTDNGNTRAQVIWSTGQ